MLVAGPNGSTVVVEREDECAALAAVCERAVSGRGAVALIESVAGSGKTALLDVTERIARERDVCVLRARATELAREIPLELLRGLFSRRLARLSATQRAAVLAGAAEDLASALGLADPRPITDRRLQHATYWLVAELGGLAPTVLLVDDVQWADPSSLAALVALADRLDDLPVSLVLTHRPDGDEHVSSLLAGLTAPATVRLHPTPLSRSGVATVLRSCLGAASVSAATVDCVLVATGGNPFLVTQFAAALADAPGPLTGDELAELTRRVSRRLSSLLTARVWRLGPNAVALARAVVILGDDCGIGEACAVAAVPRDRALRAAAALATGGIFARDRITAFAHPLVRTAISADLVAAERARLQERAVTVLLESGADARRSAKHLLHTEPTGSERAVAALRSAAAAANAAAAPAHAALLLRRAIAEAPAPGALVDEAIAAELAAGEFEQATIHIRRRLAGPLSGIERGDLTRWLGRAVMQMHGIPAAVTLLDDELGQLEGEGRLKVEAEQAWMCVLDPSLADRLHAAIARHAGLAGETPGQRAMLAMVGLALSFVPTGSAARVAPILARAFGDGALLADEPPGSSVHAMASYAIILTEQFAFAERELTHAVRRIRETGAAGLDTVLIARAITRLHAGRLGDAEADGLEAIDAGRLSSWSLNRFAQAAAVSVVADVSTERGDVCGAMATIADNGFVGELGRDPGLRALSARAYAHLAAGRATDALADAERLRRATRGFQDVLRTAAPTEALAHLALGDRAAALDVAGAHLRRARAWGTPAAVATALRVTGLARGGGEGVDDLREAVALLADSAARLERARCQIALGMLLRRAGQRRDALAALRSGADLAQRLGARRIAIEAREEMIVLGARPRRLAFSGADALTAAERRVAQLAGGGRSNREIAQELYLSLKTVEAHLSHAYRKLGIRSRGQLTPALRSLRPDEVTR